MVATVSADQMALLVANTGGAVQALPNVTQVQGKRRTFTALITLSAQVAATVIALARLPVPYLMTDITLLTDTSLGSTTIKIGNTNSDAMWYALTTLTATDTPTKVGKTSAMGVQQNSGYDAFSGLQVTPYAPGQGGALYDDIILTTAAATMPGSGTLKVFFEYVVD